MMPSTRPPPKLPTRERGSVVVYTGVTLLAILIASVIAIEMGRVYSANRNLQKMASLAALDAVREASRCSRTLAPSQAELEGRVTASLQRNGVFSEIRQVTVEPGIVQFESGTRRRFLEPSTLAEATAVRVTLRKPFPALLTGLLPDSGKLMVVSATAEQPLSGAFEVGSGLASLSGGMLNGVLGALLGGSVNLTAVDYTGLAGVNVTLEQLATALDVDVQDLSDPVALQANAPLLRDSLLGLSDALGSSASSTVVNLVRNLASAAASNTGRTTLDQLLGSYDLTGSSAPVINLLDLLLDLAASTHVDPAGTGSVIPVNVSTLNLSLPAGLAVSAVGLRVLEAPQAGRGRPGDPSATASTAQVRLMVRAQVNAQTQIASALSAVLLGGLLGTVTAPPINIGIDLDAAKATAFLDQIDCPQTGVNGGKPMAQLSVEPAVATVRLGTYTGVPASFPAITSGSSQLLGVGIQILGGLVASINVNLYLANPVSTTAGSGTEQPLPLPVTQFDAVAVTDNSDPDVWIARGRPPAAAVTGNPQTVGSSNVLRGTMSTLFGSLNITASDPAHAAGSSICLLKVIVCTLSVPVDSIVNAVVTPVRTLLNTVLSGVGGIVDALLDPLLNALGIRLGNATVIMQSVTTDQPTVVTICRPDLPASNVRGCPEPP